MNLHSYRFLQEAGQLLDAEDISGFVENGSYAS